MKPDSSLRATPEQYANFAEHVARAHSWYKHLSLLHGARFVVFVAPDVALRRRTIDPIKSLPGDGTAPALGGSVDAPNELVPNTIEHPCLYAPWRTTAEYHRRFGHLDYMWKDFDDGDCSRDGGEGRRIELPREIEERCGFTLYPYVSWEFAETVMSDVHAAAIAELTAGREHRAGPEVLELHRLAHDNRELWRDLTEWESDWAIDEANDDVAPADAPTAPLRRYVAAIAEESRVMASLRRRETAKIQHALQALDDWLQS